MKACQVNWFLTFLTILTCCKKGLVNGSKTFDSLINLFGMKKKNKNKINNNNNCNKTQEFKAVTPVKI